MVSPRTNGNIPFGNRRIPIKQFINKITKKPSNEGF